MRNDDLSVHVVKMDKSGKDVLFFNLNTDGSAYVMPGFADGACAGVGRCTAEWIVCEPADESTAACTSTGVYNSTPRKHHSNRLWSRSGRVFFTLIPAHYPYRRDDNGTVPDQGLLREIVVERNGDTGAYSFRLVL